VSDLPKGWVETKISDVTEYVQRGKGPKYTEIKSFPVVNQKAIRWFGIQEEHLKYVREDMWDKYTEERFIRPGDILWNSTGTGTIGRACLLDEKEAAKAKVVDSHVTIVRSNKIIDPRYLFNWIKSPRIQLDIESLSTGTTNQVELSKAKVLDTTIPLAPLNEQIRIADKLDSMLAKVDAAQTRLDKIPNILKRFRQSVLAAATSGELTKEWREENYHLAVTSDEVEQLWINHYKSNDMKYKKSSFPQTDKEIDDLPEEWLSTRLGDACDVFVGSTPSRKNIDYWEGEIPWVSSSEVAFCNIGNTKEKISELGLKNTSTKIHPKGTVMLAMIGQGKTRGQPAILDIPACHNQNTAAIRVLPEIIKSEYLYYFLWRQYEETRKVGAGNNQKALNKTMVQGFFLPVPSVEEQQEIISRVGSIFNMADTVEKQYKYAKARTNRLTQSILAKAFRGELVPQDPKDEPAEKLLARIQSELEKKTKNIVKRTTKKSVVKNMKLEDAPENYLKNLMPSDESEIQAKELWQDSKMTIDDFYAQLKKELINIEEINNSLDPNARTLKTSKE
jgi:type I restriction enzyme S subunit